MWDLNASDGVFCHLGQITFHTPYYVWIEGLLEDENHELGYFRRPENSGV
jgi:hypothetical protein